jgi:hypothetical protein
MKGASGKGRQEKAPAQKTVELQKKEAPSRSAKPKAQQETAEDFQAKLMALKKKFK